ncbi:restriction endonuclease subunit S [Acinetobacter lwoffii]|uniref:restriction endonuclease subunit S n=1 Tax=Acinetobacter lwoffii TaxID=28090 RepID=UPI00189FCFE0|nr:restriction endonuclease subunit S [Acinetobacter lwoffii]QPF32604.1 restriction endonuclease subunit S [Acinetobacter lwoffii]
MSSTLRLFWEAAGGNVPEHWEFKTIDELLEHPKAISVGVMYPGSDTDGGVPLIKVSDVKNGAIASRPSFCISNKVDEEYKRTRLNGSELLLTLVGNPGDCVIVTDEMCGWNVARALAVIRLKDTQLRSWIRYVLASKPAQHLIEARLNTTVQKTLNLKDVREIGIPIPPREERDSITKVIDSIEKKTLLNTQINQTLESIAQAIFKSWFIDFNPVRAKIAAKQEGNDPELAAMCAISGKSEAEIEQMAKDDFAELQATAALFPDELVESELGEVPKGWDATALGNFLEIKRGGSPRPIQNFMAPTGYPWVKIADATADPSPFLFKTKEFIIKEGLKKTVYLKKGSLILTNSATPGLPKFLELDACIHDGWLYFPQKKHFSDNYLYFLFLKLRTQLVAQGNGSVFTNLKTDILRNQVVLVPTREVIEKFDLQVGKILKMMKTQCIQSSNLSDLRDALLPKLLSGELDVSGLQIEVA